MTNTQRILAAITAAGSAGMTSGEVYAATGLDGSCHGNYLVKLKASGAIVSAGPMRTLFSRYFIEQSHADAYAPIGAALCAESKAQRQANRRAYQNARYHANPEKFNAVTRACYVKRNADKPKKPKKPEKLVSVSVAVKAAPATFHQAAVIDYSSAKITRCPDFVPVHERPREPVHGGFASLPVGVYAFEPATCAARAAA